MQVRRIALIAALVTIAAGIALALWASPGSPSAPPSDRGERGRPAESSARREEPTKEYRRPSGFWTSTLPATNGAYRYRLLGIGIALIGATGTVMVLLVGRANATRHAVRR